MFLYCAFLGRDIPACEYERESMGYAAKKHFNDHYAPLDDESLMVELCNYKGEGEGFAPLMTVKHLPVFVSKAHSWNQVN